MATKNASGLGSIRQRSDGRWEGRYSAGFDPRTGKQIQRSVYGKTQREVRQKLNKITSELDSGTYTAPTKLTVSEWLQIWLTEYTSNVKPFTKRAYQDRVRIHILPALGPIKLTALTPPIIQKFVNDLGSGRDGRKALAPKTIKNIHGVLHRALLQAQLVGYLKINPADHCALPRVIRPDIQPLDDEAITKFIKTVSGNKYEILFLITLFTGMRQGEVLGLTWKDLNWEQHSITIKQQLQREKSPKGKYYLTTLKNDKTRVIRVAPSVMELFRKQKDTQEADRVAAFDRWNEDFPGLVFTDEFGKHLSHTTVRKYFKRLVKDIGYPQARFHDLRHTFASLCLRNGDNIKVVQEALGHYSASFTLDVYSHVTNDQQSASAQRMEDYIAGIYEK